MERILTSALLVFCLLSPVVFAQGIELSADLLRDIIRGHQLLTQHTECVSGKIESLQGSSNTEKLEHSGGRIFLFFRDKDLLRLEYIAPLKDTEVFPEHEKNDITAVTILAKDHNFQWWAIPSSGVPYANLFRSTKMDEALEITVGADFYSGVNALVSLDGSPGAKMIDLLQGIIGTVENRRYEEVPDALWIKGVENVDNVGNTSNWTVVLNPKRHYALLFYEIRVENPKTGTTMVSSGTRSSQVMDDGKILPKEIVFKGLTETLAAGQKQILNTGKRTLVTILSTDKPDARLFTEESFKDLGRDFAVVDVLLDQQHIGGPVVLAAPLKSRIPSDPLELANWSCFRIILFALGALLMGVGGLLMFFRWRRSKTG